MIGALGVATVTHYNNGKRNLKMGLKNVFYGELKTAPMIRQRLVDMELKLHQVLDFETHDIFIGELV